MKKILITFITFYQRIVSPSLHQLLGIQSGCRNNPTCSVYAKEVIEKHGISKGIVLSLHRVVNCQPFFSI